MTKLALLPFVIATMAAMLTWTTAKYMELASQNRANATQHPRARPYGTRLPDGLTRR
jgi:hypothetical protein